MKGSIATHDISATKFDHLWYFSNNLFRRLCEVAEEMADSLQSTGEKLEISYVPKPGLGSLSIVNFLLGLVTLSLYRFWGKTNVRRHIWSCIHINGQPLEYTGTGMELFKGFLIVFGVLILPYLVLLFALQLALGPEHPSIIAVQLIFGLVIYCLWGAALYRARRYQLSRTLWRGIRGTLAGSSLIYSLLYFGGSIARSLSFGWATPVINTSLQERLIGDMRFGDLDFKFRGRAGPLYPTYAICWFLSLLAVLAFMALFWGELYSLFGDEVKAAFDALFGETSKPTPKQWWTISQIIFVLAATVIAGVIVIPMLWAIYTAKELATFASYTTAGNAKFEMHATAWSLIRLVLVNVLLVVFTIGIARPFAQQRLLRYVCERIKINGTVDVNAIAQSVAAMDKRGEGLADAFDVSPI
jgi:uncharacterized membrane protein YjgN (DUF898 family)